MTLVAIHLHLRESGGIHMRRVRAKIAVACLVVVGLCAGFVPSIAANTGEDEQWPSGHASTPGLHGIEFDANSGQQDKVSVLLCKTSETVTKLGTSVAAEPCSSSPSYTFRAVLGPCTATVTVDCISGVTATTASGKIEGKFSTHFPLQGANDYTGSAAMGIPDGKTPGLWTIAGAPHAYGSDYLVTAQIVGMMVNGDALKPLRSFAASIVPVDIFQTTCDVRFNGQCLDAYFEDPSNPGNVKYGGVAADQDNGYRCANWGEASKCTRRHAFPANTKFSLTVKLRTTPTGWLHGRMQDPQASIVREGDVTTMTIDAEPTRVPVISGFTQWETLPQNIKDWYAKNCPPDCGGTRLPGSLEREPAARNSALGGTPYADKSFELLTLFRDFLKDKSAATPSFWTVRTLDYGEMVKASTCIQDAKGVAGIVSTNSALYGQGPPAFNSATGTLDYKVAALHYEKDGVTPFKGRYNLMIRSDVARCIYGFTDAPITSSIEVIDEDGKTSTASTNVSEVNGWFRLDAAGFTFSAPTIRVKMTQASTSSTSASTSKAVVQRVKRGKSVSLAKVARTAKLAVAKSSKVSAVVSKASKTRCRIVGSSVRALKKGTCSLVVTVKTGKKKTSKRVQVLVS